jgi:hypothetical protein
VGSSIVRENGKKVNFGAENNEIAVSGIREMVPLSGTKPQMLR